MKIGIISDIHDHIANLKKTINILNEERVELVLFCGDLVSCFTVDYFKYLKAPVKAIFGNNEGDKLGILRRIVTNKLNFEYAPKQGLMWDLKLKDKRIAIYHGHQEEILNCLTKSDLYSVILTGHSHDYHIKKIGEALWINPGAITDWAGLDFKKIKPTFAILNLETKKAQIIKI